MPQPPGTCGTLANSVGTILLFWNRGVQLGNFALCCLLWGFHPSYAAATKHPVAHKKAVTKKRNVVHKKTSKSKPRPAVRPATRRVAAAIAPVPSRQLTGPQIASQQNFVAAFQTVPHSVQQAKFWESATSFLGVPYRYAGNTRQGTDCSGYTSTVYKELGIAIPRAAHQQFAVGQPVAADQLAMGDLVFYGPSELTISHVGLYLGNGKYSHAALTTHNVRIDTFAPMLGNIRFLGARRIVPTLGYGASLYSTDSDTTVRSLGNTSNLNVTEVEGLR